MRDLTPRQKQILLLVQRTIQETGMPPTRAEIAKSLKFRSVNAAEDHLRALERKGVIELFRGDTCAAGHDRKAADERRCPQSSLDFCGH